MWVMPVESLLTEQLLWRDWGKRLGVGVLTDSWGLPVVWMPPSAQ